MAQHARPTTDYKTEAESEAFTAPVVDLHNGRLTSISGILLLITHAHKKEFAL